MLKKIFALVFVGVVAVGGFGCGGGGEKGSDKAEVATQMTPLDQNPSLQEAVRAEAAGERLSGSQERMLKDARKQGVIE